MTGTERKRVWRARNPERSREAERLRAQDRRNGRDGSYQHYEASMGRFWQRAFYQLAGAGAHRMTAAQRKVALLAKRAAKLAAVHARFPDVFRPGT